MNLMTFVQRHRPNNSLMLGFYGGGNYGDELLMEVLASLFKKEGIKNVSIAYKNLPDYSNFHHEFNYQLVDIRNPLAVLSEVIRKNNIIVGGGGLWGMDVNLNVVMMSFMLFAARWLLGKKIYLVAVGSYSSASPAGRLGAWLAAKAANVITARDNETFARFVRWQKHTYIDKDIAWYVDQVDLADYERDAADLEQKLNIAGKTAFLTLRRFRGPNRYRLAAVVGSYLANNPGRPAIIALMEPRHIDPEGFGLLKSWQNKYPWLQVLDFNFNPLALFLFFRKNRDKLIFIGPQFYAILSAHLTGVPYMPIAYDNKVENLLSQIAPGSMPIRVHALTATHLQNFADNFYGAPG